MVIGAGFSASLKMAPPLDPEFPTKTELVIVGVVALPTALYIAPPQPFQPVAELPLKMQFRIVTPTKLLVIAPPAPAELSRNTHPVNFGVALLPPLQTPPPPPSAELLARMQLVT